MDYIPFLQSRLGENYVVVQRRSKQPRYDRTGRLQQQILPREHAAAEREYRALYGDPHDAERREMYLALKSARLMLYAWHGARRNMGLADNHTELNETIASVEKALEAEASR